MIKVECPHCDYSSTQTYKLIEHVQEKHGK